MSEKDANSAPLEAATEEKASRDAANWAKPVSKLTVESLPKGAINLNVEGRRVVGPLQGFGQMWQKTYRVELEGVDVEPTSVIQAWKENFPSFWPKGNTFYAPLTSISPGEVAVLNLAGPGGLPLSTGIMVIYADEESFSFMTPEGHTFAGIITFSSYKEEGATFVQNQVLVRANDPIYEIGCRLGLVHRMEDQFWHRTLEAVAGHFGVAEPKVEQVNLLVDPRVQWSQARNVWHNAAIRTGLYLPVALVRRIFGR